MRKNNGLGHLAQLGVPGLWACSGDFKAADRILEAQGRLLQMGVWGRSPSKKNMLHWGSCFTSVILSVYISLKSLACKFRKVQAGKKAEDLILEAEGRLNRSLGVEPPGKKGPIGRLVPLR